MRFNHDKFSISKKKVIRGLHCDFKSWKLVTCTYGKVFFVVVDVRKKSKNFRILCAINANISTLGFSVDS